jgi:membrane protein implicated in regulation of membrane protease activity
MGKLKSFFTSVIALILLGGLIIGALALIKIAFMPFESIGDALLLLSGGLVLVVAVFLIFFAIFFAFLRSLLKSLKTNEKVDMVNTLRYLNTKIKEKKEVK